MHERSHDREVCIWWATSGDLHPGRFSRHTPSPTDTSDTAEYSQQAGGTLPTGIIFFVPIISVHFQIWRWKVSLR